MNRFFLFLIALAGSLWSQAAAPIRPPAIPLVAHDPYFSIWSNTDALTGSATRHWTGAVQPLVGLIRIDNVTWRYMGDLPRWAEGLQPMRQTAFELTPTHTMYGLEAAGVRLDLTFL